jgi:hypothetical protein
MERGIDREEPAEHQKPGDEVAVSTGAGPADIRPRPASKAGTTASAAGPSRGRRRSSSASGRDAAFRSAAPPPAQRRKG